MKTNRGALSPLAANSLLVLGAVIGSLLLCELLLRLLGVSYPVLDWTDPVRGVAFIPGAKSAPRGDGGSTIEINSDGRRGPETSLARTPGTYRIALIGDSFVAGFDVRFEQTAGEVIARRLTALRGSPVEALGSMSNPPPAMIRTKKLAIRVLVGFIPEAARRTEAMQTLIMTSMIR